MIFMVSGVVGEKCYKLGGPPQKREKTKIRIRRLDTGVYEETFDRVVCRHVYFFSLCSGMLTRVAMSAFRKCFLLYYFFVSVNAVDTGRVS